MLPVQPALGRFQHQTVAAGPVRDTSRRRVRRRRRGRRRQGRRGEARDEPGGRRIGSARVRTHPRREKRAGSHVEKSEHAAAAAAGEHAAVAREGQRAHAVAAVVHQPLVTRDAAKPVIEDGYVRLGPRGARGAVRGDAHQLALTPDSFLLDDGDAFDVGEAHPPVCAHARQPLNSLAPLQVPHLVVVEHERVVRIGRHLRVRTSPLRVRVVVTVVVTVVVVSDPS
mmetsp:Transcript_4089/g.15172  ORF Transcript_4089/g.15172 Transcript_4089/m.15172 type:complete len:226 (-) Transcript_4089:1270-1947(-)